MVMLTQFKKQQLLRRQQSDITRLADSYNKNINQVTSEYEAAFADYNKKRDEAMAPYNAAVDKYKTDYGVYETNLASYRKNLTDYTAKLEDIQANPLEKVDRSKWSTFNWRGGSGVKLNGSYYYNLNNLPSGYTFEGGQMYQKRDAGKFTEKAPTAPERPVAPEIADFDSTQFEQKKAALETDYKREVGERKAGRLSAVSRKQSRPMLQGK